jgi:hypothetical protein
MLERLEGIARANGLKGLSLETAEMAEIEFVERDTAAKGQDSGPSAEQAEQQEAA